MRKIGSNWSVTIHDARGPQGDFTLDKNGFQLVNHTTAFQKHDYASEHHVKSDYYAEVEQMVKHA